MNQEDFFNPFHLYEDIFEDHQGQAWGFRDGEYFPDRLYRKNEIDIELVGMMSTPFLPKPTWVDKLLEIFSHVGFLALVVGFYIASQVVESMIKGQWFFAIAYGAILATQIYAYWLIESGKKERAARLRQDRKLIIALKMRESEVETT